MTCRSKIAKIILIRNPRCSELKGQLTRNLVKRIKATHRSKIAKMVLIRNASGCHDRHLENLFWTSYLELKGQLTWNLVGSVGATCGSKIAKIISIGNPGCHMAANLKIYFELLILNRKASWLETIGSVRVTCRSKIAKNCSSRKSKMATTVLKIYFELLVLNWIASWL